jgi:hypothetical protein
MTYVECGQRNLCDCQDTWWRCVLAKGHTGRCSSRLDTVDETLRYGSWGVLVTPPETVRGHDHR